MPLYKNAFYWFIGLLTVLIIGFWNTYFSVLDEDVHVTHHFHAIVMLSWILLLITQSWLIRNRRNSQHRAIGKLSFVLAPAVVISGVMVVFHNVVTADDPQSSFLASIYWFGLFSAVIFAVFYVLAIVHRKNMQQHARYMVAAALVFLVPGLSRTIFNYVAPIGIWTPNFYQITWVPFLIGLWLLFLDWRKGQILRPFLVFSSLWAANLALWVLLPTWEWWRAFTLWSAQNLG